MIPIRFITPPTSFSLVLGVSFLALIACTTDPAPSPTSAPTVTPTVGPAATSTPAAEAQVPPAIATAFVEWGPTCLNGVYPPDAPTLEEVDPADYEEGLNGLRYTIVKEGEGETPSPDWEVDVIYTGWLESGCIFDSSYTRSDPTIFPVNQVIPGWQISITEMKIGERRRVEIPPALAYGADGSPPIIPQNATLTFDIILVGGTSQDEADAIATQAAEDLFALATQEAGKLDPDAAVFDPITVDYFVDVEGFLDALPAGERACMTAYAGGDEELQQVFSAQQRAPRPDFVDVIDGCMSDSTKRNIVIGRILVVGTEFSDETMSCMENSLPDPTLKPLFGIFAEPSVSKQWITTHFCMSSEERVEFDRALYAADPRRVPGAAGETYVDVQECMYQSLGDSYFNPAAQPDPGDEQALTEYFENFSSFLIADLSCKGSGGVWSLADGTPLGVESAQCVVDRIGPAKFGEVILGRSWSPDGEEHANIAAIFVECDVQTDFLELPSGVPTIDADELRCIAAELSNAPDPAQASLIGFTEMGRRDVPTLGDLSVLIFGVQSCGVTFPELPTDHTYSESEVQCIVGKIDQQVFGQSRSDIFAEFTRALSEEADCRTGG